MPQMAPLMWTLLYTLFTVLLILSMTKLFYSLISVGATQANVPSLNQTPGSNALNWKW